MGSLKPRTGYSPTRSRSKSLSTKSAKARDSSTVLPNCLVRVSRREAILTAGPMTVKSSRVRDPILPYMTSPTWTPMPYFSGARPVSPFLSFSAIMAWRASATACSRFAQADGWLSGKMASRPSPMYFPAMSRNRLRHRVEIAVQEINDVIARPVVGNPGEITQVADHDGGAYRRPAPAPGGAGQNEFAGMRPDIGFEQRSRQTVLDADFADQRQSRQQFQQAGDIRVVETSLPVGRKGHEMPLAERMVQRPRHIVGQAFRPHLVIDGVLAAKPGIAFEILAHLGGTVMDFVGGTIDVFGSLPDVVVNSRKLCLAHPVGPHDPGAKPLRMMDQDMKRRPLDGNARSLEPDTQLSENIVNEALIARVVCQPVHNVAVRMRGGGNDVWRGVHIVLLSSDLDRRYGICRVSARRRQRSPLQSSCAHRAVGGCRVSGTGGRSASAAPSRSTHGSPLAIRRAFG